MQVEEVPDPGVQRRDHADHWYADHGYRADIAALRHEIPGLIDFDGYLHQRGSFADEPIAP